MARIYIVEPGPTGGPGNMGVKILAHSMRQSGHDITIMRVLNEKQAAVANVQPELFDTGTKAIATAESLPKPDAWFISTIYTRQWLYLPMTFRRMGLPMRADQRDENAPLVVFGGQTSFAPEPIAPFADIVALGDGELTGNHIGQLLDEGMTKEDIMATVCTTVGFYVPQIHMPEDYRFRRWEMPNHEPIIIWPGDEGEKSPTVEVARGCQSKCAFCPIGWAGGTYREGDLTTLQTELQTIAKRRARVNLFAPDYSSVSYVSDLDRFAESLGCKNAGLDARLDKAEKHMGKGGTVKRFSFGIEGLSDRLRKAIGKPLKFDKITEVMSRLEGVTIKWYVIIGLPGETKDDFAEFKAMCEQVMANHGTRLDVTLTHLQAVPHTPLERDLMLYNEDSIRYAHGLRLWAKQMWEQKQWMLLFSALKGRDLHEHDAMIQRAGREAADYLEIARHSTSYISEGKWREDARERMDVGHLLGKWDWDEPSPWDFVEVGTTKDQRMKAREFYDRAMANTPLITLPNAQAHP